MKRAIFVCVFFAALVTANAQISLTADSLVISKWDLSKGRDIPVNRIREDMSIEIDKDLLTIRILGENQEMAYIEKAYLIDFLEVNDSKDKWLFEGSDKNCVPYTITLDIRNKRLSFISVGKANGMDRPLSTIYYTLTDVKINDEAIQKHLLEKGNKKY